MRFLALLLSALVLPVAAAQEDDIDLKEALRHPDRVFPTFQKCVARGLYAKAYDCLSPATRRAMSYEAFLIGFTAFEAPRRLIATSEVHALDLETRRLRLCSREFAAGRDFRLGTLARIHLLDLSPDDIEYFKGRALSWFRFQVRRADGWHFAYPPDWDYAPQARTCLCGP